MADNDLMLIKNCIFDYHEPRNKKEEAWQVEHSELLNKALKERKCPMCGEPVDGIYNVILDHGYLYGLECGGCR